MQGCGDAIDDPKISIFPKKMNMVLRTDGIRNEI
jgi:hypothetical protein